MPKGEWSASGWSGYKKTLKQHIDRCASTEREEPFHFHVAKLVALAFPLVEGDEKFVEELKGAERRLGERGGRPDVPYRLSQLRAVVRALHREGAIARAEIPLDESGALEERAGEAVEGVGGKG